MKERKLALVQERKLKEMLFKNKVNDINRDMIQMLAIHTPFHDIVYTFLFMLSMILTSLRVDNIVSSRYVYLFIPGFIACAGWTAKGNSNSTHRVNFKASVEFFCTRNKRECTISRISLVCLLNVECWTKEVHFYTAFFLPCSSFLYRSLPLCLQFR